MDPQTVAIAMPLGLALAGITAWWLSKKENPRARRQRQWRDDSLDAWRRQREAEALAERERRLQAAERNPAAIAPASERDETETKTQQRLGG